MGISRLLKRFFEKDDCIFWQVEKSDYLMDEIKVKLSDKDMTGQQQDHYFLKATIENVLRNPLQLIFLMGAEGLKIFFWESSTEIGFVVYPQWIKNFFEKPLIKYGLRFLVGIITFISFFYSLFMIWKNKTQTFSKEQASVLLRDIQKNKGIREQYNCLTDKKYLGESENVICNITFFIIVFTLIHSCFFIQIRYISTIAPLWIILIAYFFNHCFCKK